MEADTPKITVDRFESHGVAAKRLREADVLRMPAQHAIAHHLALFPVQRVVRLARLAGERTSRGPEPARLTILPNPLVRTFHVVDPLEPIEEPLLFVERRPTVAND